MSYLLTEKAWTLLDEGRKRIYARSSGTWDRSWSMVILKIADGQRGAREDARRRLAWLGFGQLNQLTWMSPHALLDRAEHELADLPLETLDLVRCSTRDAEADQEMASRCWDLSGVQQDYAAFIREFDTDVDLRGVAAFIRHAGLVGAYRRFPFEDPDLPLELLPREWVGSRAHEVFLRVHAELVTEADRVVAELTGLEVARAAR